MQYHFIMYLLRGGDLPRLGGDHLLGDGDLRRLYGDHRPLLYEVTRRGERERDRLRLSRLRDRDLEYDREREREAEDLDRLRFRPFLSRDRVLSFLSPERDRERDPERDRERELECCFLKFHKRYQTLNAVPTSNGVSEFATTITYHRFSSLFLFIFTF